eukprot:GGOE01002499.1.p1 GENE.GGOE01002499.1~~GGOE01002499.1.p1  ORF type:complete len:687 (-),score=113.08 GGOE01002499.1:95-1876(-)
MPTSKVCSLVSLVTVFSIVFIGARYKWLPTVQPPLDFPISTISMAAMTGSTDVTSATIIGAGRVGKALAAMNPNGNDMLLRRGQTMAEGLSEGPIYVCTRNDDLAAIIEATPSHRHKDLVFFQNGMLDPLLEKYGMQIDPGNPNAASQCLVYFAVANMGDKPTDGITDLNPDGLTAANGRHAETLARRLRSSGLSCKLPDPLAFKAMMLEKHIWICSFMLAGVKNGGVSIGEVERSHREDVTLLICELLASCAVANPQVPFDPLQQVAARLLAYARSVGHFPTALKELRWRNGYFWDLSQQALAAGKLDLSPTHTAWMRQHGPPLPAPHSQRSTTRNPKYALLFDCDGVIVLTEELHRLAYNGAFRHFNLCINGQPMEWSVTYYDILQNTVGGGKPKMRWHFGKVGWPTYRTEDGPQPIPETEEEKGWLIDALQDQKTVLYKQLVTEVAAARPGVLELMEEGLARPDIAMGICSAATKAGFDQVVNSVVKPERLCRFDIIKAGDDVEKKKPDPMIYNMARELLQLPASRCIVIEDSLVGLRAAKAAGMRCVITYTESTKDQDFFAEGADAVMADLSGMTVDSLFKAVFGDGKV